ncbi:MAG: multicopper oxidase domain-containing protein [Pseudomonadales bacterium]|nr:multicopper oxidase domain-containing protein [Pseudomonadales bacterium]
MRFPTTPLLRTAILLVLALLASALLYPPQWYPLQLRFELGRLLGVPQDISGVETAASNSPATALPEEACPQDLPGWRQEQVIEGVSIAASLGCLPDNPYAIAAFVKGTNNVSTETLLLAGLAPDAVVKGADLDGDGDADEIHIRLEVVELNGGSPDSLEPTAQFEIAPGIKPALWVFAPKSFGMATENFESDQAMPLLRLPSPAIRVEQGDRVKVTLENTHYLPHTIHFHGVDHPWLDANGQGNDGVPISSEMPLLPGEARTYEFTPRNSGTLFYHCHVQPQAHVLMGLQGMFIIEEQRADNTLQTLNIGAGHVRVRSADSREHYDEEFDLHYTDIDSRLGSVVQSSNQPATIRQWIEGGYDLQTANSDLYTLNGRAFPYTFRESLLLTRPDSRNRLRVLNAGSQGVALHTHGHKARVTHYDGVELAPGASYLRDVFWIASGQRLDLTLSTHNDGIHSYGSGVWLLHDHQGRGVMNNGIAPGGNVSAIVYEEYLGDNGWPITYGEALGKFFDASFYTRAPEVEASWQLTPWLLIRLALLMLTLGLALACLLRLVMLVTENNSTRSGS